MTSDFVEDFTQALNNEGKFFIIAIFDQEIEGMNVVTNIEKMPNLSIGFIYPTGKKRSKLNTILDGIKFCLKN